jgi:hypothetical protein
VITLCSWLTSQASKKPDKDDGGGSGGGNSQGGNPAELDDPEGKNEGGNSEEGGQYSSDGLKDKGAGNIRTESFTRLGKLLDIIPNLHRAESFLLLLTEARQMVETAWEEKKISSKSVAGLRKALEFVQEKIGEEKLPVITTGLLLRALAVLEQASEGVLPSEESTKELINTLEAEERKVAQIS